MGIDFSKFSQEIQAKIKTALSDDKIDAAELRAMNLEKDIANKLMQELAGNQEYLGDGYIKMQNKNKTLILLDKPVDNSFISLTKDSLDYYHAFNKDVAQGIYKDGMLYMADSKGRLLKDKFNNYICERVSVQEYTEETQDISGTFEIIENEPVERTNRRFAVALIRSMYAEIIGELQTILSQMGVMDVGFWREALGMGIQAFADLKENQQLITASTIKKIERIEAERDNICDSLNDLIDSPAEFESKFYQLVGKDYRDNAFNELRDIQHNQENKNSKTKFKECLAKFNELYPENNISKNIENWEDSAEYQKTVDEIANIVVMLYMTGGIGKIFQGSVQTIAKNILLAAAKGDKKTVMTNFAKLAPEVQTVWKSLAKKEFGVALTQTVTPMAQSVATMSSWEGIKAFLNNLTNAEEMSPEELLSRTLEGVASGAEMGVIMGGLEVAAIAPMMTKMTPVLNKLTGASAEISGLIEKGNGVVSMEKVMETYSKASETLRGKIVKEGAHTLAALPTLTVGFTVTDTAFHFDEAEFRKQLLDAAVTDEERDAIMKMNSIDLRLEFAKTDFINQVKGMATIEGVGLMFRRLQAGRLAGKTFNQRQRDIIGANLRPVNENGKTVYEICSPEGEVIPIKDGNKTLTRFTTIEQATSAYSALCMSVYSEINAQINEAGTREAGIREVEAEAEPSFSEFKINPPKVEGVKEVSELDLTKAKVENREVVKGLNGYINLSDETGKLLGFVNYNIVETNGRKYLNFEGLKSNIQGQGIGTKLIQELIKISEQLGAEGRLTAYASPMTNKDGKVTNIEFYYKLGFRAVDAAKDAEIRSYIEKGEPVPVRLNVFTEIEFKPNEQIALTDGKYNRPLTEYDKIGNKVFEISKDLDNPEKIAELKAEIETLRKTDPQKADELQIVLEMFTNPTSVQDVTDAQIDAVVNYLNNHYDIIENYLTEQVDGIGLSGENLGKFGHRIKGEWSTRDKIVNYINDEIEKGRGKTLLDAYKDVRDKYACRTVFNKGDYANHPEIKKILEEGNYSDAAYRKAELRAAELQSQPAVEMLKEAMRKAVEEGKDLKAVRISNYSSEDGIPIFSQFQLAELKQYGARLGLDVEFIRLAKEINPKAESDFIDGSSTKQQPSGYTALQINFETKAGEIIEWQYRGELVNKFAEAEHLPYDLRTGKHPWNQIPELEAIYKPIADLLEKEVMPKHAYAQLNKYFTDYYTHLRRLELGFESTAPKLEDYQKYKDENGIERTFEFDKRLSAENLMILHDYAEGIKDGVILPERALEEYHATIKFNPEIIAGSRVIKNGAESIPREQRIKNLSQTLKEVVGKDYALELSEIKDENVLSFLEKELPEWDDSESVIHIINLVRNAERFRDGGFTAMDEAAQRDFETSCYWGDSVKDLTKKAELIEDTAQREKALANIKMHVYCQMLLENEIAENPEFRTLIMEKFIKPSIPEEYYNAINELEELSGKKVCIMQGFTPKRDNLLELSFTGINAWMSMSDKVKNFYKRHANKLINEYNMVSEYLKNEFEKLSESELEAFADKGGIDYQYHSSISPKDFLEMDKSKLNEVNELCTKWKNSDNIECSPDFINKLLNECTEQEIEIIDRRQIYKIRTEIYIYLEPKYIKILARLSEQDWKLIHDIGLINSENQLQLPYIEQENDPFGNMERHDLALKNVMNALENLKGSLAAGKKIQALGYTPTEAFSQAGALIKGLNEADAKALQEYNWTDAKAKYENISRMVKTSPDKYISGQVLSMKSLFELFTKEVLSKKYEYKRDLQRAIRDFFYENDIANCEFYSNLQQCLSNEIRSNSIDIAKAKDLLKDFFENKISIEEHLNNAPKPEDIIYSAVNEFLTLNEKRLTRLCAFMDKEGLENLLRKRFSDVKEYLDVLDEFNYADLKLLNDLSCSYNLSGKPFLPTQKIEFIDLISAYKAFGLDMSEMHKMVKEQRIDTAKLHKDLFFQVMKKIGMSEEEVASIPKEKLLSWDLKYMHLLAKEMAGDFVKFDDALHRSTKQDDNVFADIIRNSNLRDFKEFIQDTSNIYGQTNSKTKAEYIDNNMNYDAWINIPQNLNVRFHGTDKDTEALTNISEKLLKDINLLRQNSALRGILDKQFKQCIKNGEFIIPSEYQTNAVKLKDFIGNLLKALEPVKTRALSNIDNPQRGDMARKNIEIIQSIESSMFSADNLKDTKASKTYNFTIKMWDRNPQHDLFQGNYSTCCIGMGGGNGSAHPHYLLNTSCNMVEIIDETSSQTIGNALCFFAKNAEGKPILIIDNVEINNKIKFTDDIGKRFRSAITQFASNVANAVTGTKNTEIFLGASYNDIPISDLTVCNDKISFIGKLDCEELYLDVYSGWINTNELEGQRKLLRLK